MEKQICFTIVWGCAKILPLTVLQFSSRFEFFVRKAKNVHVYPAAGGLWHVTINGLMCHKTVLSCSIFYRSLDTSVVSVLFESFFETFPLLIWNSPIFTKCAILELKNWTYTPSPCVLFSMSVDGFHSPSATLDAKLNKLTSFLGLFTLRVIQFRPRGFVKWKLVEKVSARANSSLQILKTLKTRLV